MHSRVAQDLQHIQIIVHGDFATGGFAFTILFLADKYGIKGFIKYINMTTLNIEAEGTVDQLTKFAGACKKEPEVSEITSSTKKMKYYNDFTLINNL